MLRRINIYLITVLLLTGFIFLLYGCKTKGESKKARLNFIFYGGTDELPDFQKVVKLFEEKNSDIKVKIIHVPDNRACHQKAQTMIAGGTSPDVMLVDDEPFVGMADKGIFLDLGEFINRNKYNLDDFYPKQIKQFTYKEKLYGLPKGGGCYVYLYNKDIFDKYNMPYPEDNWTWQEFLETAKKLTIDINNDGRIDTFGCYGGDIYPWIWGAGGDLINEEMTECIITSPEAIRGIQFYIDLSNKYHAAPHYGEESGEDLVLTGKISLVPIAPFVMPYLRILKYRWGLVLNPTGPAGKFSRYTGDCWCISRYTKHPEEAWEFVKFLASPEGEKVFAKSGRAIPARKSIAQSNLYVRSDIEKKFIEAIEYSRLERIPVIHAQMEDIRGGNLELVHVGKITVKEACERIKREVDVLLKENGR